MSHFGLQILLSVRRSLNDLLHGEDLPGSTRVYLNYTTEQTSHIRHGLRFPVDVTWGRTSDSHPLNQTRQAKLHTYMMIYCSLRSSIAKHNLIQSRVM